VETISVERQGTTVSVLGIPGTVSAQSLNVDLLGNAAREAPGDVVMTIYLEQGLWEMPPFEPGAQPSAEVERLRDAVESADAIVLSTPEYNGSLPGGLKNAIDWIAASGGGGEGPLSGKPAAVIGADRGRFGCDWAVADARKVLEVAGANVLPAELAIGAADEAFADDGALAESEHRAKLGALMELLALEARAATEAAD
jgi:chromate reductase